MKMKTKLKGIIIGFGRYTFSIVLISLSYISLSNVLLASVNSDELGSEKKSQVILTVHNVGQGNCIDIKLFDPETMKKPEYMLIDIGSRSYNVESIYTVQQKNLKIPPLDTPLPTKKTKAIFPDSEVKKPNYPNISAKEAKKIKKAKKINTFFDPETHVRILREKFKEQKKTIRVKTVIITHPDMDHYSWLTKLFSGPEDQIDHLILGGLPNNYYQSNNYEFKKWIKQRIEGNSKVYFPAIKYNNIDLPDLENVMSKEERTFADHLNTLLQDNPFFDALSFETNIIKLTLLSINPTHFKGNQDVILRMSSPEDDNSDSLVLKVDHGKSSAILTGDATYLTTNRIINDYITDPNFLRTNVLLASHHGSATHGSNNKEWIEYTQPEYVLISNGHIDGHPQSIAYEMFKQSKELKRVTKHNVLVGKSQDYKEGSLHTTERAIFSTLNSGNLIVDLNLEGGIKFETQNDKKISEILSTDNIDDSAQDVFIDEDEDIIILSPKTDKKRKKFNSTKENSVDFARSGGKKTKVTETTTKSTKLSSKSSKKHLTDSDDDKGKKSDKKSTKLSSKSSKKHLTDSE